jgi:hypothetical protein
MVPFPLTQKFRGMLQRGVDIENLSVRYISSLSLYFLILFGVSKLHSLLFSGDDEDDIKPVDGNHYLKPIRTPTDEPIDDAANADARPVEQRQQSVPR